MSTIHISVPRQVLELREGEQLLAEYSISTSQYGLGFGEGSFRTPTGHFRIGAKIGENLSAETIFQGRLPVGEWGGEQTAEDLILGRILWLEGCEERNANTRERFIYIHGTNHEESIGRPGSWGCVRMRRGDVVDLYDRVTEGTEVFIEESA